MSIAASTAHPAQPSDGRTCVRCGQWNERSRSSCRDCFAPLNDSGVLEGLERPIRINHRAVGGSLFACLGVAGALFFGVPKLMAKPVTPTDAAGGPEASGPRMVAKPIHRKGLAKFEPVEGCLLGAFVMNDHHIGGSMRRWEEETRKGHASYLRYVGYGQPFPKKWVNFCRGIGAVPNIAFEPNAGLDLVKDNEYLRQWARDAAHSGVPVFLRFASEMNGDWTAYNGKPRLYREKFQLVAKVMREEAPNVAMVWTPYCLPLWNVHHYYPGDAAVDWVGVNIYSVHHHNGNPDKPADWEDPQWFLNQFYRRYAKRKPIQVSEFATTHVCQACGEYTTEFAIGKMERMYEGLRKRFPRVKSIYWFSWDTISGGSAENNYSIFDDPEKLATYRRMIASDYFLSRMPEGEYYSLVPASPAAPAAP